MHIHYTELQHRDPVQKLMNTRKTATILTFCLLAGWSTPANASFRDNHPKLAKFGAIAGVGALTGGVGGILMGSGLIHGAAVGAGTHVGFHALHEKWKQRKQRRQHAN
jgi:hypothetical protein